MADQEGYYQPKTDEVLNQRYKVIDVAGKGVFSCVVRATDLTKKDSDSSNKIVAIKIMRT